MSRTVVVTGVGAVTPLGVGARVLVDRWSAGEDGFAAGLARCDTFDPKDFLSTREIRRTDRFVQLALAAADEAVRRAGWNAGVPFDPFRVACVVGSGIGGVSTMEAQLGVYRDRGSRACSPLCIPLSIANAAAAAIAMRWEVRGHSSATVSACAAGAEAVASGARLIRSGEVDAAVVGGSEAALSDFCQAVFANMRATSPTGTCRPFDARRDGFVMGEGAGMLVLEEERMAVERRATILARLAGIGTTSDAFHLTAPDPEGVAAAQAIRLALADAALGPSEIDYVNAHGTGTAQNDVSETRAIKAALGRHAYTVPISSTKSAIGHLLGGAGAVDAVATVVALCDRVAPPTLQYAVRDEQLDLNYAVAGPVQLAGDGTSVAMSNSFGFGGHNVVLVLTAEGDCEVAPL